MSAHNPLSLDFLSSKPDAAARVLQSLPAEEAALYLGDIPVRILAPVLERMETWPAARILAFMPLEQNAAVFGGLPYQNVAALLRLQQPWRRTALLNVLPSQLARSLGRSLAYQETTVGAWMDMSTPCFHPALSAGDCLALLKQAPEPFGTDLIVVDHHHRILGVVALDRLLTGRDGQTLASQMDTGIAPLSAEMSLDSAARATDWHSHGALPVRDNNGTYLGALHRKTLYEVQARHRPHTRPAPGDSLPAHLGRAMASTLRGLLQLRARGTESPSGEPSHGG